MIAESARVAITAPPPITPISQMGMATFFPTDNPVLLSFSVSSISDLSGLSVAVDKVGFGVVSSDDSFCGIYREVNI